MLTDRVAGNVLDVGGVSQLGRAGADLETLLAPQGGLMLERDGEPFAVLEIARLRILGKLAEAARRAVQPEFMQQIESGMVEHRRFLQWKLRGPRMLECTITVPTAGALGLRSSCWQGSRWRSCNILSRLCHLTFFSLGGRKIAARRALTRMNERAMRRLVVARRQLFEAIERSVLGQLQATRGGPDYHVEIESFFYPVPRALIRQQVDVCVTAHTIEVFHRGKRVAAHTRRYGGWRHGTDPEHTPSAAAPSSGGPLARPVGRLDA